ncbi:P4 alpha zinc-binding domain-containing protein [Agrobacterium rhizogenes]|nr:P4 alpha zinc-binding domain-containing protein [Rhizobium rhizogenes]
MTDAITLFIEEARAVTVVDAALALGIEITNKNYAGPCPSCGGTDRFSINPSIPAFNCRQCGGKGRDGISLMALSGHHDVSTRVGFLSACSDALGRPIPEEGERESDEDRRARLERIAQRKRINAENAAKADKSQNDFRQREVERARGIWLKASDIGTPSPLSDYLYFRTGFCMHEAVFANLRLALNCTYWHGRDERGFEIAHYTGPAMIAPFVNLDGRITGCHQTWIDLRNKPKYRANLGFGDDGSPLPAKKMRGTKRGSLIPLCGLMTATRWVGGEGIENGLAIAGAEDFRADTFYFAAGDLGNLAGPADPKSAFSHPYLAKEGKGGRIVRTRVQGPVPKPGQQPDEAMQIPDHVMELVLLADGDSEPVMTAAAMARAEERFSREGRATETWWPPEGSDFSKLMTTHLGIGHLGIGE